MELTPEERQKALDDISPEDLAKIQAKTGKKTKVSLEVLLLAEFATRYGWDAYKDARDDKITSKEFIEMIEAGRKLDYLEQYRMAQAAFYGSASAQSKKPGSTFQTLTRKMVKNSEADE